MPQTYRRASLVLPVRLDCSGCAFSVVVPLVGRGRGNARNPYFVDEEGAADEAQEFANAAAEVDARHSATLMRCPRCGREPAWRHARGLLYFATSGLVGACVALSLVAFGAYLAQGFGVAVSEGPIEGVFAWGAVLSSVGALAGVPGWLHARRLAEVDAAVFTAAGLPPGSGVRRPG